MQRKSFKLYFLFLIHRFHYPRKKSVANSNDTVAYIVKISYKQLYSGTYLKKKTLAYAVTQWLLRLYIHNELKTKNTAWNVSYASSTFPSISSIATAEINGKPEIIRKYSVSYVMTWKTWQRYFPISGLDPEHSNAGGHQGRTQNNRIRGMM